MAYNRPSPYQYGGPPSSSSPNTSFPPNSKPPSYPSPSSQSYPPQPPQSQAFLVNSLSTPQPFTLMSSNSSATTYSLPSNGPSPYTTPSSLLPPPQYNTYASSAAPSSQIPSTETLKQLLQGIRSSNETYERYHDPMASSSSTSSQYQSFPFSSGQQQQGYLPPSAAPSHGNAWAPPPPPRETHGWERMPAIFDNEGRDLRDGRGERRGEERFYEPMPSHDFAAHVAHRTALPPPLPLPHGSGGGAAAEVNAYLDSSRLYDSSLRDGLVVASSSSLPHRGSTDSLLPPPRPPHEYPPQTHTRNDYPLSSSSGTPMARPEYAPPLLPHHSSLSHPFPPHSDFSRRPPSPSHSRGLLSPSPRSQPQSHSRGPSPPRGADHFHPSRHVDRGRSPPNTHRRGGGGGGREDARGGPPPPSRLSRPRSRERAPPRRERRESPPPPPPPPPRRNEMRKGEREHSERDHERDRPSRISVPTSNDPDVDEFGRMKPRKSVSPTRKEGESDGKREPGRPTAFPLCFSPRNFSIIRKNYSRLWIPPFFIRCIPSWVASLTKAPFPLDHPVSFSIDNSSATSTTLPSVAASPHISTSHTSSSATPQVSYDVKVALFSGVSLPTPTSSPFKSENLSENLKFVVVKYEKQELRFIGTRYVPEVDGDLEGQSDVPFQRAACRALQDHLGLSLKAEEEWMKFMEIHYSSSDPQTNTPVTTSVTMIFIPPIQKLFENEITSETQERTVHLRTSGFGDLKEEGKTPKIRSATISLDGLLDYEDTDKYNETFEVSLFAEGFHEMLQFTFGNQILQGLLRFRSLSHTRKRKDNPLVSDTSPSKKRLKVDDPILSNASSASSQNEETQPFIGNATKQQPEAGVTSENAIEPSTAVVVERFDEVVKKMNSSKENRNLQQQSEISEDLKSEYPWTNATEGETELSNNEEVPSESTVEEKGNSEHSVTEIDSNSVDVVLLRAFQYFDPSNSGYLKESTLSTLLHSLPADLSKWYVQTLLHDVTDASGRVQYDKLVCDEMKQT